MKTFLWTTLFWIIVAIAGLLCLGFGNLWTQVLDNGWLARVMPSNLQTSACDSVVSDALENIDRCAAAEANNCNVVDDEADVELWEIDIKQSLENIVTNQQIIYSYLQESFANTNEAITSLSNGETSLEKSEPIIDEKQMQKLQLQAQIEALQAEMANL